MPGLQFILAGLVGKTAAFYGVPAMRLALDVIVYMGVISVFVTKVVVLQDAGNITPWEVLWLVYLLGAIWQQVTDVCFTERGAAGRSWRLCSTNSPRQEGSSDNVINNNCRPSTGQSMYLHHVPLCVRGMA